ncbi:hypothetical protein BJY52DRAFT_656233 [Lactarius psammicola]|nr:hypothetical protein BJY52DRAFT_656233 [Lactarius psammicola]
MQLFFLADAALSLVHFRGFGYHVVLNPVGFHGRVVLTPRLCPSSSILALGRDIGSLAILVLQCLGLSDHLLDLVTRCIADTISVTPCNYAIRYHQVSVLSVLGAVPLGGLMTPRSSRWYDMRSKHSWDVVPENWECLGRPPAGTTIDPHIALKGLTARTPN